MIPFKVKHFLHIVLLAISLAETLQSEPEVFEFNGTFHVSDENWTDENWTTRNPLNFTPSNIDSSTKGNEENGSLATTEISEMTKNVEESISKEQASDDIFTVSSTIEPGLDVDDLIKRDQCFIFGRCERVFSTFVAPVARYCQCDANCTFYGDCCVDVEPFQDEGKISQYTECVPIQSTLYDTSFFGISAITKCPESYSDLNIKDNCRKTLVEVGPYVAEINGPVYKNRYCAICHGAIEYEHFMIKISKMNTDLVSLQYENLTRMERLGLYLSNPGARYEFIPPNGTEVRTCAVYDDLSDQETDECKHYGVNPIFTTNKDNSEIHLYRNAFCKIQDNNPYTLCYGSYIHILGRHDIFSLTAIFSFSSNSNGNCKSGEDKVKDLCVADPQLTDYSQDVYLKLISSETLDRTFIDQLLFSLVASVNVKDNIFVRHCKFVNGSNSGNGTILYIHMIVLVFTYMPSNELVDLKQQLGNFRWKSIVEFSNTTIEVVAQHVEHDFIWVENGVILSFSIISVHRSNLVSVQRGFVNSMNSKNVYKNSPGYTSNCFDLFVKLVKIDDDLYIEEITCIHEGGLGKSMSIYKLQSVITYVGNSLSIFALFISITISRKLKMCDSVPGNNLENLSITLALSNVFFMVGIGANDYQKVCYVFGVILHYLWLASFSFMTIAVTFMCCNLFSMPVNVDSDKTSSKRILTFIGLSLPLIFVLPSIVLDFLDIPMFEALYAGTICFPTGFLPNAVFVTGPITLCVLLNFIALCVVIIYMSRHSLRMNHVRRSQSFNQGVIYIRICTFTGITWIFAIIGSLIQSVYVDFIAIILCSLQGLAVALGNLTTKRMCTFVQSWHENGVTNSTKTTPPQLSNPK